MSDEPDSYQAHLLRLPAPLPVHAHSVPEPSEQGRPLRDGVVRAV